MKTQRVKQVFRDYLSGKSKAAEKESVDRWYQSFDTERVRSLSEKEELRVKEEIWDRIAAESGQSNYTKRFRLPQWLKVAALLVSVSVACWMMVKRDSPSGRQDSYTEIITRTQERKNIRLADGTLLSLNASSRVRIRKDFSKERRVEIIDGEAFFDVEKDHSRPFIITSGSITTHVLGTSFNISAYQELSSVTVRVLTGKVSVSPRGSASNTLTAGQQLVYNKKMRSVSLRYDKANDIAWIKGKLLLDDLSFDEMAVLMRKNFGVKIIPEDESIRKTTRYTTTLPVSMKPDEAVDVLAAIHNFKVRRDKEVFYFIKPARRIR